MDVQINANITYRQMRQIFSKEEIKDLVMYKIISPIEKRNTVQSWKFYSHDITPDLYTKLIEKRNEIQTQSINELLANKIENEWKITSREGMVHRKTWKATTE